MPLPVMVQRTYVLLTFAALTAPTLSCTSENPATSDLAGGTGGSSGGGAGRSSGGQASSAGSGSGGTAVSGGNAGMGNGGASGTTGGAAGSTSGRGGSAGSTAGMSGTSPGGAGAGGSMAGAPPAGGAGGLSNGGAGSGGAGAGGASGGTGGAAPGTPSAGCGKGGRPSGGNVTVNNQHIYTFPTSYDGMQPFPLFMGFHAAGNPIDQIQKLTNGSALDMNYVRAFGKSSGNEWVYNTDISKVTAMYDEIMANYCIDTSRVFAAGHSSGAQMIVQILTKSDAATHFKFKAVAPVAASNYGAITAAIPVMYIQGKMDKERNSDGADVVARFTAVNGCSTMTMAYSSVAMCMSGSTNVNPGCVQYQGCTQPTIWCSHNDPEYSGTNHGWPCFAAKAMGDFFASLP